MMNCVAPDAAPEVAFTPQEVRVLDQLVKNKNTSAPAEPSLATSLTKVARLGGYLARGSDPPPGNLVIWRGLAWLTNIALGFQLGVSSCG